MKSAANDTQSLKNDTETHIRSVGYEEIHLKVRQEITECIAATMKGVYLPFRGDKRDEADERFSQQKSSGDLIKTTAL